MEDNIITRAIFEGIQIEIKAETERAIEEAKKVITSKIPEITSRVSLDVMKRVNFERMGDEILVRINLKEG